MNTLQVSCCIAGGGPAGMMLGLLLARAGVRVVVIEKHADFLRDFRGDTIHPSTLEVLEELGLMRDFASRPHQKMNAMRGWVGKEPIIVADFSRLPVRHPYIAFMPQWDFLDFLRDHAETYPNFQLILQAQATDVLRENDRVVGIKADTVQGPLEVRATLVVAADGRHSVLREKAGLKVINLGAPIDVLWMRISRKPTDPDYSFGRFDGGRVIAMLNRESYWQCAYVITKGGAETLRERGLPRFRENILASLPFLEDRVAELQDWEMIKLLTVRVDRLEKWSCQGLLCIGDAAHAMSPIGGVGINLAIQDAVATANLLTQPLKTGSLTDAKVEKVQRRRQWPTVLTQRMQVFMQDTIFTSALSEGGWATVPLPLRMMQRYPVLTRITGRMIGMGVRPEHVQKGVTR